MIMHYKTKYPYDSFTRWFYYVLKYTVRKSPQNNPVLYSVHSFIEQSGNYCKVLKITISCSNEDETQVYRHSPIPFHSFFHLCVLVTVGNQQPESVCMYHNI